MRDISGDEQRSYRGKSCPPEGLPVFDVLTSTESSPQRGPREFHPGLLLGAKNMVEVVLHVPHIILDNEAECDFRAVVDAAGGAELLVRNPAHQFHQEQVIASPEFQ